MTLRGVIQGLLRGSDDAEAMLADEGYGDLPAEIFGQALSSYADTAPMAEADALSPVLTTLDAGNASDVFAVLEEQPLDATGGAEVAGLAASILGVSALDDHSLDDAHDALDEVDEVDGFGTASSEDADIDTDEADEEAMASDDTATHADDFDAPSIDDPDADGLFGADQVFDADAVIDSAADFEEQEEFFDSEPIATGEDPSDLDF